MLHAAAKGVHYAVPLDGSAVGSCLASSSLVADSADHHCMHAHRRVAPVLGHVDSC